MTYFVYILRSLKDGKLYIGATNNVSRRLIEHNKGKSKSTKARKPFILIYTEMFTTLSSARKREWYFKNTREGNKWLKEKLKAVDGSVV